MSNSQEYAPFACQPNESRGRLTPESECRTRSPHQRDRDRIIHSAAFRRLEYKTQVFVNHEGDHYRTRLTHSLEVSQLSRSVCRVLRLNEDLGEALALAHDLGHTPFGHAGEEGLDAVMQPFGGFDHNAQTLRILTQLEARYAAFDGLNLTWETLEGLAKHNGPVTNPPRAMLAYAGLDGLELDQYASLEAQVASLADDIAYNNHDLEDGLRAGMFTLAELETLPLLSNIIAEVRAAYPSLDRHRSTHEVIRRMINRMVNDLIEQTRENLASLGIESVADIRAAGKPTAQFSPAMLEVNKAIKAFLMTHMYRHYKVNRMTSKARRVIRELFQFYLDEPSCLPPNWQPVTDMDQNDTAIRICDFVAGMTDRFALEEHERLFNPYARS